MFGFDNIELSLNLSSFLIIPAALLILIFSWFVYRYTLPELPDSRKYILVFIRAAALIGILLLIFEPTLFLTKNEEIMPKDFVFIDNSRSITIQDGTDRSGTVREITDKLKSAAFADRIRLFTFGQEVKLLDDKNNIPDFSEPNSNFEKIFSYVQNSEEPVSSILIISDGVITRGENPVFTAEKLGIPVNTVIIGDTSERKDIRISSVLSNEYAYAGTQSPVKVSVENKGFAGQIVSLSFLEDDSLIYRTEIKLQDSGFQNEIINYTPTSPGEKKLTVKIDPVGDESTKANNLRIFYMNILGSKIKILLVAGSPSSDVSFITQSLRADTNVSFQSITVVSENKIIGSENRSDIIESAEVLFLVGFPSAETPEQLLEDIFKKISDGTPYFLVLSSGTDFNRLKLLQKELAFSYNYISNTLIEVQPEISDDKTNNPLLKTASGKVKSVWENLPPVNQPDMDFAPKPESELLAKVKINNVVLNKPLILTRKIGRSSSISVLAGDIWRWKLQIASKDNKLFDSFIQNSLKWLNSPTDRKRFSVSTKDKIYQLGEPVDIKAQVYDEVFNPLNDARVEVVIKNKESYTLELSPAGNGLYEGRFYPETEGNFTISGKASVENETIGTDSVLFSVGEFDAEFANVRADAGFLNLISNLTGGKNFTADKMNELFQFLNNSPQRLPAIITHTTEFNLWSFKWILGILILLFSLEWFLRKRWGLL